MLAPDCWDLTYRCGTLHWDQCSLKEIANTYRTPVYVVSETRLKKDVQKFTSSIRKHIPHNEIFYSLKTSGVPQLLTYLREFGIGAEVCSKHELDIALRYGIPSSKIIFSGINRSAEEFRSALDSNIKCIIIDLVNELYRLDELTRQENHDVEIGLRLALNIHPRKTNRLNRTSATVNQFGLDPVSNEFQEVLKVIRGNSHLKLTLLHSHIGSGLLAVKSFHKNVEQLISLYAELKRNGFPLEAINVGGGLGVETVKEFSSLEFFRYVIFGRLPSAPKLNLSLIDEYASTIKHAIQYSCKKNNIESPKIIFEPGRVLTSNAILLLLRVGSVRERGSGNKFALVDGGSMSVGMSCLAEYHEVFLVRESDDERERYTIVGKVPTALDFIYRNKSLPKLQEGDYIAVMDAGAYFIPTATNFASLRTGVVLLSNGNAKMIRRHETVDDFLLRDDVNG